MLDVRNRVLVMEPSSFVRDRYVTALLEHGYRAIGSSDPGDAMRHLEEDSFELVVIDRPLHDHEVNRFVRRLASDGRRIQVLLLESEAGARENGFPTSVHRLPKPEDPGLLVREVRSAMARVGEGRAAGAADSPPTLLVVDDSATFRSALVDLVGDRWTVRQANCGREALDELGRGGIDAVLLDNGLPDMRGIDVCRALRRDPANHTLPVVMLTAAEDERTVLDAFDAGADDYVVKGCRDEVLLARVGAHVRRRRFELAARRATADLQAAEAVSAARAELLARLQAQAEELQRANQDLERFASVASHDLQAPLRVVTNYLDLIKRRANDSLDERCRSHLDQAIDSSVRMTGLIQGLLHYARRGWDDTSKDEPCDSAAIARRAVDTLVGETGAADVEVRIDVLPRIVFDPVCLLQVFQNLVGNAIKYRSRDPVRVVVGARRQGAATAITVADNGSGIEQRHLQRIFGMFERLHGPEIPGTGIGLALCQKIVVARGGGMGVESEPGRGSTFWFTVPEGRVL